MTSILIIEDDTQISRLINSTLTVEGYHCESALDGQEGADRIEGKRYDLILLDLMCQRSVATSFWTILYLQVHR